MDVLRIVLVLVSVLQFLSVNGQLITGNEVQNALTEILEQLKNSESVCANQIGYMLTKENFKEKWIRKMIDAWSKIPSGLLSGNIADLGAFDQCLATEGKIENEIIKGKYCKVLIPLTQFLGEIDNIDGVHSRGVITFARKKPNLSLAICLPDTCSAEELNIFLQNSTIATALNMTIANCQSNEPEPLNAGDWAVVALFIILLVMIIASTGYDIRMQHSNREPAHMILIAFSWYSHGKKLFSVTRSPNQLPCLHGIRFISMMWVIVGHTYYATFFTPTINGLQIAEWLKVYSSMWILGATLSVDTFFVLGGLLMSYIYLSAIEKGLKFNIIMYYIHRYIRLTPALAAVILVHVTLLRFFGSGPYWPEVMQNLEMNCSKYWWSALLYVQNYVNSSEMCIGQTWYLSVDMQIFLFTPLILIPLGLWPRITVPLLWLLTLISMAIPFSIAYVYELPGLMSEAVPNKNFSSMYYNNTYVRFGPVVVGMLLGYYIYCRKQNTRINSMFKNIIFKALGWIISLVSMYLIVFEENNMYFHKYNRIESSFYLGVHRVAWCIALMWVIYACIIGHGGIVNTFLSLPIFQILSRLTYSMYLLHLSLLAMKIGILRVPIYFSNYQNLYNFCGDICFTIILAIIWTLVFESPMITVEKILFKDALKTPDKQLKKVTTQS